MLGARSKAATQPVGRDDTTGLRMGRAVVRARGLATGVCLDTIVCIVAGGRPCVATYRATWAAIRRATGLCYGAGALRHARQLAQHGTQHGPQYHDTISCRGRGLRHSVLHKRDTACDTASARCNMACDKAGGGSRYDT